MNFIEDATRIRQQLDQPRTANQAAATLYPKVANNTDAFLEREGSMHEFPYLELMDLSDEFWAWTLGYLGSPETPVVYVPEEEQFRRFHQGKGIYEPVSEAALIGELLTNLDACAALFPQRLRLNSYLALKNRPRLKSVVERAKDLLAVDAEFFNPKPHTLALKNGILALGTNQLNAFSPASPLLETLPVNFDPAAKCDLFLNSFLSHVLAEQDVELLQRYLSQILDGTNHSQTILVMNGASGWGKSTLIKILGSLFGWKNVGIIRDQVFKSDQELAHYLGKRLLLHPDMPTDFLDRKEASLFKQLVGGDPLWAEDKAGSMITLEGRFPCILCCNGKPRIKIDSDNEAWMRRLLLVPFRAAEHEQHLGRMAEMIVKTEASGILNWLLEGRRKLVRSKLQLLKTEEQQRRTQALVMASQSPKAFVKSCLERKEGAEMVGTDLYAHYQQWCLENQMTPFAGQYFNQMAKDEIDITLGLRYRHDLKTQDGTMVRGWKNLAVVQNAGIESKVSG